MKPNSALLTEKPGKALFFFALPMILGNFFQQFYNMADSVIVGRYVGEDALAAVGASYSFTTVFIMIAIGGGIGASVLTSQFLGAGMYRKMKTSAYTSMIAFLTVSILLACFGFLFNPTILRMLKTPENIYDQAVTYLQIYFMGLPFMFMYNILAAEFNALGQSRIPLYLLIFSSVLNIFLDLMLVICFGMGVEGVAIATVIAQGISAVISFVLLLRVLRRYDGNASAGDLDEQKEQAGRNTEKKLETEEQTDERSASQGRTANRAAIFDVEMLVKGTKLAIPSIIQQSIVSIGMLLMQSSVNAFGSSALAGYSAGGRMESVCIVPMISTGNAVSTYTAQNLGAGQKERVKKGLNAAYGICISFGIVMFLITHCFADQIMSIFVTAESSAVAFETGTAYIRFLGMFYTMIGLKATTDGVLRGSGDTTVYMIANLVNLCIRVSVAKLLSPVMGIWVIWGAIPLGWTANFLISRSWYQMGKWQKSII